MDAVLALDKRGGYPKPVIPMTTERDMYLVHVMVFLDLGLSPSPTIEKAPASTYFAWADILEPIPD